MKLTRNSLLITFIITLSLCSCLKQDPNEQVDEGNFEENVYFNEELGWTMKVPKGFFVTSKSIVEKREKKGLELIEESSGLDVPVDDLKHLLSFNRGRFHNFQSTSQVFVEEYEGEWLEQHYLGKELLIDVFKQKELLVDTTESTKILIGGIPFMNYKQVLFTSTGDTLLEQNLFSSFINGFDFNAIISGREEKYKKKMLEAFLKSTFKQE